MDCKKRYPSASQKRRLYAIIEADEELRGGKFSSTFTKREAERRWQNIAKEINGIGGAVKNGREWKKTWQDMKSKTKKKQSILNRAASATGGSPPPPLTEEESIVLRTIGKDSISGHGDSQESVFQFIDMQDNIVAPLKQEPQNEATPPDLLKVSLTEAMKIGFIGGGRLAFALANGFISAGLAKPDEITASCHPSDVASAEAFKGLGATALYENKSVVERSEVVIVSVKPDVVAPALKEVKDLVASKNKLFISVAMGVSTGTIEKVLPNEARVIRVMPNTPALVKEGAAALARGSRATPEDAKLTAALFRAVGSCEEVPEYQMDAVTALSGSGPAYVYMMIEALAEGGVRCGLPRDLSLRLAAQTTLGAAAMLRNGGHPAIMKDNVTSPAGSTAEGTYHLEQNGFRAAVIGAVAAAKDRCKVVNEQLNN